MGKIRIKVLGGETEKAQKKADQIRREEKKKRLTHISGMKGGEKVVDMSALENQEEVKTPRGWQAEPRAESRGQAVTPPTQKPPKTPGQAYLAAKKLIDKNKVYSLSEAIGLVQQTSFSKFDGSVETHINLMEKGVRGQVSLPHSIGKEIKVRIADEKLIEQLQSGKIDFDILVASPSMMPKLVRFAKFLGPKGLMPNPKAGTISEKPEETAKRLSSGQLQFKSESEAPIIHFVIGKTSFPDKNLEENFLSLTKAIGKDKIKSCFLKATMGPSVKVAL